MFNLLRLEILVAITVWCVEEHQHVETCDVWKWRLSCWGVRDDLGGLYSSILIIPFLCILHQLKRIIVCQHPRRLSIDKLEPSQDVARSQLLPPARLQISTNYIQRLTFHRLDLSNLLDQSDKPRPSSSVLTVKVQNSVTAPNTYQIGRRSCN